MTEPSLKRLYNLLPAIYRIRDFEQGEPLRALLAVAEAEGLEAIERDIDASYRNWFIETCEPWVVPYIADLLGVQNVQALPGEGLPSLRAYVANTLAYRRRKGTAAVLEQLAWDVAGWRGCVVEFFELLGTTQHVNHVRPSRGGTACLRDGAVRDLVNGPFEKLAHTVEMRRAKAGGHYRIPTIGLSVWRLQSYPVSYAEARSVSIGGIWKGFAFSPIGAEETDGLNVRLFNPRPRPEPELAHVAKEVNLPCVLRRRPLYEELEALRQADVDDAEPSLEFFEGTPPFAITLIHDPEGTREVIEIPPEEITICALEDWRRPDALRAYAPTDDPHCIEADPGACPTERRIRVAVDPELGRMTFADPPNSESAVGADTEVRISYAYGFSGDVGAGPYDRQGSVASWLEADKAITWQRGVTKCSETRAAAADPDQLVESLWRAVDQWNAHAEENPGSFGVIAVMDSSTYDESLTGDYHIRVPAGCRLAIVAADWTGKQASAESQSIKRKLGNLTPDGLLPHVKASVSVEGTSPHEDSTPGELILDGLLIEGPLTILGGDLGRLSIRCTTLIPGEGSLQVNASAFDPNKTNSQLAIEIERSILGAVEIPDHIRTLSITDSVLKVEDGAAISAPKAPAAVRRSTVLGECKVRSLEASDSIFEKRLHVERTQVGCMRFTYVGEAQSGDGVLPPRTPRRYHCQPDFAVAKAGKLTESERQLIRSRVTPAFTSVVFGDSGFAQLAKESADEIRTGAENGSEMGAFSHLMQPQRTANLRAALEEYLPFGMEIALDYET